MRACRICLDEEDLIDMRMKSSTKDRSIFSIFLQFSGLDIEYDANALICPNCENSLTLFFEMRCLAVQNHVLFSRSKIDDEDHPYEAHGIEEATCEEDLYEEDLEEQEVFEEEAFEVQETLVQKALEEQEALEEAIEAQRNSEEELVETHKGLEKQSIRTQEDPVEEEVCEVQETSEKVEIKRVHDSNLTSETQTLSEDQDDLIEALQHEEEDDKENWYVEHLDNSEPEEVPPPPSWKAPKLQLKTGRPPRDKSSPWDNKCPYCFLTFNSFTEFTSHRNAHEAQNQGLECHFCGNKYLRKHLMPHMRKTHLKDRSIRFSCDLCGKTFSQRSTVQQHKAMVHSDQRQFVCHICSKSFKLKNKLDQHVRAVHERRYDYMCDVCKRTYTTSNNLKIHVRNVHSQEKPYECAVCGKRFASSSNRSTHEKLHTTVVFTCDLCDFTTNTELNLKRHHINRHSNLYNYCCSNCGMKFKCSTSLKLHSYTHQESSFECAQCKKLFSRPQGLKAHIDSVHLQKKVHCPECNAAFSTRTGMMSHLKTQHQGLRIKCACGKDFSRRARYNQHVLKCEMTRQFEPMTVVEVEKVEELDVYEEQSG